MARHTLSDPALAVHELTPGFLAYTAAWMLACLVAACIFASRGGRFAIAQPGHWRWPGLIWNLEWREGRGVVFGFMLDAWPGAGTAAGGLRRVFWYALPLMLFAAIAILSFVFPR